MARDYAKEYRDYHGKPEQIKRRAGRVMSRRKMEEAGKVAKGDGKDVDHKDFNPRNMSMKNLRVTTQKANRARKPR
jgi:hypothetical protein